MANLKILFSVLAPLLCIFASMVNAEMTSTSFSISTSVISSGGNTMLSDNFNLVSTLGQPGPLGNAASDNYNTDTGFWYTLLLSIVGDINGDGGIDLKDIISALQVMTGQTPDSIVKEADTDGDGRIGIAEAIMIFRKIGDL